MRDRKLRSFRLTLRGTEDDRENAKGASIITLVVGSAVVFMTHTWLRDAHILVEILYWELACSFFGFALLGVVWGYLRPPFLDRAFEAAANRLCLTLLVTPILGIVIVAVIILLARK